VLIYLCIITWIEVVTFNNPLSNNVLTGFSDSIFDMGGNTYQIVPNTTPYNPMIYEYHTMESIIFCH
jgi:hypothetical protein